MAKQDETPQVETPAKEINRKLYSRGMKVPRLKFKTEQLSKDGVKHPRFGLITQVDLEVDPERMSKALLNDDFRFNANWTTMYMTTA